MDSRRGESRPRNRLGLHNQPGNADATAGTPGTPPRGNTRDAVTATDRKRRLLGDLNEKQQEAVTAPDGPVLVIAGPGSGKTRVIISRIAYLIEQGRADPGEIAAITFTRKAAGEMSSRLESLLPPHLTRRVWISTFHRLCGSLLREHGAASGIRPDFGIADETEQINIMRQCMFDAGVDIRVWKPQTLVQRMSVLKNVMKDPANPEAWEGDEHRNRNAELANAYQTVLRTTNRLDFDDMLLGAVRALHDQPDARKAASRRHRHILIDEGQDTNGPQYMLTRLIAEDQGNVFVVGDPDQAIYGWRGAELRNILDFQKDFANTRRIDLDTTYRSSARLLEAAQAMIRHNRKRMEHPLRAARDGSALTAVHHARDATGEAAFAVDRASARISRDDGTVAVLYRTNAQSRGFESGFKQAGIPYRITGGQSFYDRPEIQDALACLQMAWAPDGDDGAMRRVVDLPPLRQIGKKAVAAIDRLPGRTFWRRAAQALGSGALPDWQARSLAQRFELAREASERARALPLDDALEAVLATTGYLGTLEKSADPDAGDRADNVRELIHDAYVFRRDWAEDDSPKTRLEMLAGFLAHCRSMRAPGDDANARVTLSTLHRAKGLEFDTVIITGFDSEHLPSRGTENMADGDDDDAFEEERRLAYVGMTRARSELYLSVPQTVGRGGRQRPTQPSPFLNEIPAELLTAAPEPKERQRPRRTAAKAPKRGIIMGPYGPEIAVFDN